MAQASAKSMELEGNLKTFQLPDLLRFLAMGKMTGTLTFKDAHRTIDLQIRQGQLIGTASPERFLRLGELLVYNGYIKRRDLEDALQSQAETRNAMLLGEMLIERQLVTSDQVKQVLLLQIKEEIWELFSWEDGQFKFEHGPAGMRRQELVSLPIETLIQEGLERRAKWKAIERNICQADEVYRVRADIKTLPEEKLSPSAWKVLSLINGRNNVRTLVYLSGLGRFETVSALDHLLTLELIEFAPRSKVPTAASSLNVIENPTAAPASQPGASPSSPESAPEKSAGLLGGLFGKRAHAPKAAPAAGPAHQAPSASAAYLTSVAWACAQLNQLACALCAQSAAKGDAKEPLPANGPELLEKVWHEEGMRFPRADMIQAGPHGLDASLYERYIHMAGGLDVSLTGSHDDSMAALAAVGRELIALGEKALGDRVNGVLEKNVRPYLENVNVKYPADFMPRNWAQQWAGRHLF